MAVPRLTVIGIDGGTFDLFRPWAESGDLPNLKRILESGAWGTMRSSLPPVTCPAWKCFSTGKRPENLGMYWWRQLKRSSHSIVAGESAAGNAKQVWDLLGERGVRCGILGVPLTYPPRPVNGFLVCGGPHVPEEGFTYPPELGDRLKTELSYQLHPKNFISIHTGRRPEVAEEVGSLTTKRFDVARLLAREYAVDFLDIGLFYINLLQHFCWNEEPVLKVWRVIDRKIGEFIEEGTTLLIHSDHGVRPVQRVFYLNSWLMRRGMLCIQGSARFLIDSATARRVASLFGLRRFVNKVPHSLVRRIPFTESQIREATSIEKQIDWERSLAFALPQGPIYVLAPSGSEEYHRIRNRIIGELRKLRDPETGRPVIERVWTKEELYVGRYTSEAPDLYALAGEGIMIRQGIDPGKCFGPEREWRADNDPAGIFLAHGPGIRQAPDLEGIMIFDIAPTILHMLGAPVPEDMDGRVLSDVFEPGSDYAERAVERCESKTHDSNEDGYTPEEEKLLEERLRGLGYIE